MRPVLFLNNRIIYTNTYTRWKCMRKQKYVRIKLQSMCVGDTGCSLQQCFSAFTDAHYPQSEVMGMHIV